MNVIATREKFLRGAISAHDRVKHLRDAAKKSWLDAQSVNGGAALPAAP